MTPEQEIKHLKDKVVKLEVDLDNLIRFDVNQRVICALKRHVETQEHGELDVSKGTMALRIGIDAATFSRCLHKIEKFGGVKMDGYKIVVTDRRKSRFAVCDGCAAKVWCKAY